MQGGKNMKDSITEEHHEPETVDMDKHTDESSFDDIKQKASTNLSQLLGDLQAFEQAVREENIPEIYRLYNSHLNDELKRSSNENHEIDQLLMRKIQDRFLQQFPFMELVDEMSPTLSYYKIGTYYHERPTIAIDASLPEIFVLPQIDAEWEQYSQGEVVDYSHELNELDAKVITAQTEIERLDEEIGTYNKKIAALEESKGFLNRKKIDEEIEALAKEKQVYENEKLGWLPYIDEPAKIQKQKEAMMRQAKADQLKAAIVQKEQRQIARYFGGRENFGPAIHQFLMSYLGSENPEAAILDEGGLEE